MSARLPEHDEIPISPGVARLRLPPTIADAFKASLGVRDLTKGERAEAQAFLSALIAQAAQHGYVSKGIDANDDENMRLLKARKLDGVLLFWRAMPEKLQSDDERALVPRFLEEACTDFRPRPGHAQATPTHVVLARAQREEEARALERQKRDAPSAERLDFMQLQLDEHAADVHKRLDAQGEKLDHVAGKVDGMLSRIDRLLLNLDAKPADAPAPPSDAPKA